MARKNQYPERIYTDTHASCGKCKTMKLFSEFTRDKSSPKGFGYWCKICAASNSRKCHAARSSDLIYKLSKRDAYIKFKFGFSLEEYLERLAKQNSACAICGMKLPPSGHTTHLDHSHKTGKIRAFLCTNCNRGLGHFQDSTELLLKAKNYLETHSVNVDDDKEV